jgi:anti-sigma regulatory factor (Ser/Thr protein kinase)
MTQSEAGAAADRRAVLGRRIWRAEATQLAAMRAEARRWLAPLDLPDDVEHDVILAVHEAAANAIEHAYPPGDTNGHVELTFWLDGGNLCLSVADHGEWRESSTGAQDRGRGLDMIRRLGADVAIDHHGRGTRVVLQYPLPDMPAADRFTTDPPLPESGGEMRLQESDQQDHLVLAVRGVVSSRSADEVLRQALSRQLLDRGRVVVDLSAATVQWDPVVQVFPDALAEAGGWPLARLVLARPDPLTARILQASRVHLTVPLATTLTEARRLLDVRPLRLVRDHDLPNDPMATGLARAAVASACEDWALDDGLYEAAATVVTELVGNALEHAATACVLHLAVDSKRLRIAVRDNSPVTDGHPQIVVPDERGYGLLIVRGLSRSWGVTPHAGGKTVWALLNRR